MIIETIEKSHGKICICKCDYCRKEFVRQYVLTIKTKKHFCNNKCKWKSQIGGTIPPDVKQKISNSHKGIHAGSKNAMYGKKGKDNPNYGLKRSQDCRNKISESNRRRKLSDKTKQKIRNSLLGRTLSLNTIAKISGKNHSNWQGGVPNYLICLRSSKTYYKWQRAVLKRDNYTCQICGASENLVAHHIKNFNKYPELRFEVSNGITLCRSCHTKVHRRKEKLICQYV